MPAQVLDANDGDDLAYSLVGADGVFEINEDTGMITVASDGISDSDDDPAPTPSMVMVD